MDVLFGCAVLNSSFIFTVLLLGVRVGAFSRGASSYAGTKSFYMLQSKSFNSFSNGLVNAPELIPFNAASRIMLRRNFGFWHNTPAIGYLHFVTASFFAAGVIFSIMEHMALARSTDAICSLKSILY